MRTLRVQKCENDVCLFPLVFLKLLFIRKERNTKTKIKDSTVESHTQFYPKIFSTSDLQSIQAKNY